MCLCLGGTFPCRGAWRSLEEREIRGPAEARGAHSGRTPSSEETRSHSRSPTCGASEREVRLGAGSSSRQDNAGSRAVPRLWIPPTVTRGSEVGRLGEDDPEQARLEIQPLDPTISPGQQGREGAPGRKGPGVVSAQEATCEFSPNPSCPHGRPRRAGRSGSAR